MPAAQKKPPARSQASLHPHRGPHRRGSTIVQALLLLPVTLLLLYGIMEYCRYVMLLQVVTNAAREGCRYAVMHTDPVVLSGTTYGNTTSNVTSIVTNSLGGESLIGQMISVYESDGLGNNLGTWTNTTNGQWITVQITGSYKSIVAPFLMMPSLMPITATATMQCEAN